MPAPRPVKYTPAPQRTPPRRPQYTRAPVCGVDCHQRGKQQTRLAAACCAAVAIFVTAVCIYWPHHHAPGMPWAPGPAGGSSRIYPHSPAWGAAAIAGEAKGAARVAGGAARWGFRGARLSRGGGVWIPGTGGFHGYGFGIFGGL